MVRKMTAVEPREMDPERYLREGRRRCEKGRERVREGRCEKVREGERK